MTAQRELVFDGPDLTDKDAARLTGQLGRVLRCMRVAARLGSWLTLREISEHTGDPEPSISARLRDLRKDRFGHHKLDRRRRTHGLWEYRLVTP